MGSPSDQAQRRDIIAALSTCESPGDIVSVVRRHPHWWQSVDATHVVADLFTAAKHYNSEAFGLITSNLNDQDYYRSDSESRQKATMIAANGAMCARLSVQRGKSCNYEDFEPYVTVMDVAEVYVRKVIHGKLQQDKSDSELTKAITGMSLSGLLESRRAAALFVEQGYDDVEPCVAGWMQQQRDGGSRESCNEPFEDAAGQSSRATEELGPADGATRLDWNDPGVVVRSSGDRAQGLA